MPGFLSRLKARDGLRKKKNGMQDLANALQPKPKWDDAYTRASVEPEEVHELLHFCTAELKARGLDIPLFLLPYRPTSDPSAVRAFIRHFHDDSYGLKGEALSQDLRMTEPMVIAGVVKWCWSRLPGGIVGWDAYELFKIGEGDSHLARDSFKTFIPLSVESGARQQIIFDFFELIAAIAAHGKNNGFGGLQLARMAAWWAFEQKDTGSGFDGGYRAWVKAADATTHLFFAHLRSLTPEEGLTGITLLPRSLEKLLNETEYPPARPASLVSRTNKLVMLVDSVSPTPFALLRRAGHFQYRDSDPALQEFSEYEDPVQALTEECLRVLRAISAANESQVSSIKYSTSLRDASWSRFEDIGFSGTVDEEARVEDSHVPSHQYKPAPALRNTPASATADCRPTTPSWADFLSSGFVAEGQAPSHMLLPPGKVLPPLESQVRQQSSHSHRPRLESNTTDLQPGELASIAVMLLDHAFWWVWMSSLAPEETSVRKAAFGRCAVIETKVAGGSWLVMEEMIASSAPKQDEGAYIAEKKGLFSWTRRGRSLARRKSVGKHALELGDGNEMNTPGGRKTSIGPDTQARIQAKAAQMRAVKEHEELENLVATRRGRMDDSAAEKTMSVLTLQPQIVGEASSAMKWVSKYDKGTLKDAYMANSNAGRGVAVPHPPSFAKLDGGASPVANGNELVDGQGPAVPAKDERRPTPPTTDRHPFSFSAPLESESHEEPRHETVAKLDDAPTSPKGERVPPPVAAQSQSPPNAGLGNLGQDAAEPSKDKKGLLHLLKRKNRSSRVPDNASADLPSLLQKRFPVAAAPAPAASPAQSPPSPEVADSGSKPRESAATSEVVITAAEPTLTAPPAPVEITEPTYDPSVGDDVTPADAQDAAVDAQDEFARFDQGPLADQPAFVPAQDDDDAAPPPIARRPPARQDEKAVVAAESPVEEKLNEGTSPGVQDRWAQIRKNAAQRAATRQQVEPVRLSKPPMDDDDTSVEETIESRVARIKARVAELTGNMETGNGPQQSATGRS